MRCTFAYNVIFIGLVIFVQYVFLESVFSVRGRCPRPVLKNGWVKLRSRGRIVRFNCLREYQLLGEKFATCLNGEWDSPAPLCIKPGCVYLNLDNGQIMTLYRGAVVMFFCNPGYALKGPAKLYCDGRVWNGTAPKCTAVSGVPATSCDFENEDLCGWTQYPRRDFSWIRLNHNTLSDHDESGPSFDHTLGKGGGGYYLYVEASGPQRQNDTARLFSPVYNPDMLSSQPSCFIFWYHMYGTTVGSLAVYIKPANMDFTSNLQAAFLQFGNKGDRWLQGAVSISAIGVPFQIVIEAMHGEGYVGNIAIDDVHLVHDSDCHESTSSVMDNTYFTEITSTEVPDDLQSCRLRCAHHSVLHQSVYLTVSTTERMSSPSCDCHSSCMLSRTCCGDYNVYCIPAGTSTTTITSTTRNTKPSHTYPIAPPLPPLEPHPLEDSPFVLSSTTIKVPRTMSTEMVKSTEEILQPIPIPPDPTPLILMPRPATFKSTATSITSRITKTASTALTPNTTAVTPMSTATTKTTTTTSKPKTTAAKTTTTITQTSRTRAAAAITMPTLRTVVASSSTSYPTFRNITLRLPTTSMANTSSRSVIISSKNSTAMLHQVHNTTSIISFTSLRPLSTIERATNRTPVRTTTMIMRRSSNWNNFWHSTAKPSWKSGTQGEEWRAAPVMQSEESVPISLIAAITVLIAVVTVGSIAAYIIIRHRSKSQSQQNLAEDSDVRFLTADEILDFTLARPREEEDF